MPSRKLDLKLVLQQGVWHLNVLHMPGGGMRLILSFRSWLSVGFDLCIVRLYIRSLFLFLFCFGSCAHPFSFAEDKTRNGSDEAIR